MILQRMVSPHNTIDNCPHLEPLPGGTHEDVVGPTLPMRSDFVGDRVVIVDLAMSQSLSAWGWETDFWPLLALARWGAVLVKISTCNNNPRKYLTPGTLPETRAPSFFLFSLNLNLIFVVRQCCFCCKHVRSFFVGWILLCYLGAIKPKRFVFDMFCHCAKWPLLRTGEEVPDPRCLSLQMRHCMPIKGPTYPQLRFQAFQSSLPTPTNFWRWAAVPAQRVCLWSAPWWVLREFVCVGRARSKPIGTRVSHYGVHYGVHYGARCRAHHGARLGFSSALIPIRWLCSPIIYKQQSFLMYSLRKHQWRTDLHGFKRSADGLQHPRSPSARGAVCHPRYAFQRYARFIDAFSE